jgi:transposase-like protein
MARSNKYGIRELRRDFPSDKACLEFIFNKSHSRKCSCGGMYSLKKGRKLFQCSRCRFQIAPTAKTAFHKSSTSLVLWFHAIMVFSNAKSGISAKQLERHLAVTYKCAWRILYSIRTSLAQSLRKLEGVVEIDGAYMGGRKSAKQGRSEAILSKPVVLAAIERTGEVRVKQVQGTGARPTTDFIFSNIDSSAKLMTDKSSSYIRTDKIYRRQSVNHSQKEYVRKNVHVNAVESFWSHVKRSVAGNHKSVSKQHLQSYLDALAFHYNNRDNDRGRFQALLGILLSPSERQKTPF